MDRRSNQKSEKPKKNVFRRISQEGKEIVSSIFKVLIMVLVICLVAGAFIHLVLLVIYDSPTMIGGLNYCEFTYGKGWEMSTITSPDLCVFKQENGTYKVEPINQEQVSSRYCKRKFYHPNYCGV